MSLVSKYEALARDEKAPEDFAAAFLATGHIDLWDGEKGVHAQYPDAAIVWFWRLG